MRVPRACIFALLLLGLATASGVNNCIEQIRELIIDAKGHKEQMTEDAIAVLLYTGKSLNNLGNFDSCRRTEGMKYALTTVY